MPDTRLVQGEGITLDILLWRRDGRAGRELLEASLDLNPGLADLGPIIPQGTEVLLADRPVQPPVAPARRVVSLFGDEA